jgi:hypothetical protein
VDHKPHQHLTSDLNNFEAWLLVPFPLILS